MVHDNEKLNPAAPLPLAGALAALGIGAEVDLDGRWARFAGERGAVYVIASAWGDSFYTWCDIPGERAVERYSDPVRAIRAGLRRAAIQPGQASKPSPSAMR
jgi:hypothetical protein